MSSIVLSGDTSGTITVTVPAVAGTNTATLPAATGTVMVSGNMPAFSAYANAAQSCSSGIFTKIAFNTKVFDTNNNFDAVTNYRFTPTVAGYYQINTGISLVATTAATSESFIFIYKNGSIYSYGSGQSFYSTIQNMSVASNIVFCNGSTDYIEAYVYHNVGSSVNTASGQTVAYISGAMVRAA
jgi:hypothetical protein